MSAPPPPWPQSPPTHGNVVLRAFRSDDDVGFAMELGRDSYVPLVGTLPADPTPTQAEDWVRRQIQRHTDGKGFSFAVAERDTGTAVATIGLGLRERADGRAAIGYAVSPRHRRRGFAAQAITAVTTFAWTIPELYRTELHIEPWNVGSWRAAERAGYQREGLLRSHQWIGGTRRDMYLYAAVRPR